MVSARISAILFVCFLLPAGAEEVGEITFIDGAVEINRDGEIIDEFDLEIGSEVENYDQITTGSDGDLIVGLTSKRAPKSEIHVSPNTTFAVELNSVGGKEKTTFSLITGSLLSKVEKLAGRQAFEVRTESVALGVRGTNFVIQSSPAGDLLITCEEGSVLCFDEEEQKELYAEPGTVVEKRPDELFRAIPVAVSDLETFKEQWLTERISAFKSNARRVLLGYVIRYNDLLEEFNERYDALVANRDVLQKWYTEDREDRMGSLIERMREKRAIIGHLFRIRATLFIFERVYYRLVELKSYFDQGFGRGQIQPGLSATQFFNTFTDQRRELAAKMGRVRYIIKLYSKRNDGSFPLE